MVFASPIFLFLFLPATLAAYYLLPLRARNCILLVASVAFYAWGELRYVPLVLGSVAFNYVMGRLIGASADPRTGRRWLAVAIIGNLALLALFKYANFAVANVNAIAPVLALSLPTIALPLGISFFTFHAISYVVDVHKRNALPERNLPRFALYILLFPQLIAGPIIRWRDIAAQLATRATRAADVAYGARRFILGLGKKVLIANTLGQVADRIFALPATELSAPLAWLGLGCYSLQIYFDFSGYSDMAIGLMRMLGFRILENFNYPYIARSIREFWRRWHISLSNWFRDYLYIPLGGNHRGARRAYANLIVVFLLCGLWHGASWPFVLWGAWHGVFLVVERAGADRLLARSAPLAHLYTLLVVMGGWVLFRSDSLPHALDYYRALLAINPPALPVASTAQYLDAMSLTAFVVGCLFATPLARTIGQWRDRVALQKGAVGGFILGLDVAWLVLVFVTAAAFLAAGTYNPFIYFRF
jgi:alginate O-acetyltransferase complex protein AlgI